MTTPLPERTLLLGPPYGHVRNALRELLMVERAAPEASTTVAPVPVQLTDLADQWVKAAHACVADMGSVTQRTRWQALIAAVETRQGTHAPAGTDVPALCTALRNLLLAMLEYSRLEPPVTGISDYLRGRIADGTCPSGSLLEHGVPPPSCVSLPCPLCGSSWHSRTWRWRAWSNRTAPAHGSPAPPQGARSAPRRWLSGCAP
ncbi:hypothetical protein SMICM304S_00389 [Streptomyces microflavus]